MVPLGLRDTLAMMTLTRGAFPDVELRVGRWVPDWGGF